MDISLQEISDRNTLELNRLIKYYAITQSLDQLVNNFTRVYIHLDSKLSRVRLMGFEKEEDAILEAGKKVVKTKRTQLFVLKKKIFDRLSLEEIESIKKGLELFVILYREIMTVKELEETEKNLKKKYLLMK